MVDIIIIGKIIELLICIMIPGIKTDKTAKIS